ncbi:hypothetical protein D7193_16420 [Micromonospora costi]|uniref:Uncharacterized protein n=1 Tax=Micromonospora costi TaxID=1530042 RepID=A0A3B0AAB8_9ACTN|nr:hypothetical protein D7193_16420 [Micromonospora costi]
MHPGRTARRRTSQDGRPVRPDRDSPAAPEGRHHHDDDVPEGPMPVSHVTVTDQLRRPTAGRDR